MPTPKSTKHIYRIITIALVFHCCQMRGIWGAHLLDIAFVVQWVNFHVVRTRKIKFFYAQGSTSK
jgi:hypothetical protein